MEKRLPKLNTLLDTGSSFPYVGKIRITKEEVICLNYTVIVIHKTKELFGDLFDQLEGECYIDLIDWVKLTKKYTSLKVDLKGQSISISRQRASPPETILLTQMADYVYPKYEHLIPNEELSEEIKKIILSPDLLNRTQQAMSLYKNTALLMRFFGSERGVLLTIPFATDFPSVKAVIMPYNLPT